jgi:glycosyltransferase involved in cell wall biosynthesis
MEDINNIMNSTTIDYKTSHIKFGISMASYYRKNNKSKEYLTRALNCIKNQTADNWHIYLVGDKYENNEEFEEIIKSSMITKITHINLDIAEERDNLQKDPFGLWNVGGSNAFNTANKMAYDDGCDFILHFDDDDIWHEKKIECLNYICSKYPDVYYIYHYSTYINGRILPNQKITDISKIYHNNNNRPEKCNMIHSSACCSKQLTESFKYDGYRKDKTYYTYAGDQQLIDHINNMLQKDHNKYAIFIPVVLSSHDIEKEILR